MTDSQRTVDELERVRAVIKWIRDGSTLDMIELRPVGRDEHGQLRADFSCSVGTPASGYAQNYGVLEGSPIAVTMTKELYTDTTGCRNGLATFVPASPYPRYRLPRPLRFVDGSVVADDDVFEDILDLQWEVQDVNTGNWSALPPGDYPQHPWLGYRPVECYAVHGWYSAGYTQGHPPQVERIVVVCHENDASRVWRALVEGLFGQGWLIDIGRDGSTHTRLMNIESRFAQNLAWRIAQSLQK